MSSSRPLLQVRDLHVHYGGIVALRGVSFEVYEGEIVTILGANGAGKSTTLRAISGLVRPSKGAIIFQGDDQRNTPGHRLVEKGIVHVPEGRLIFANLTVKENLDVAAYTRAPGRQLDGDYEHIYRTFPRLRERLHLPASALSGGEQQMLAIARALITRGKLMLLDEPSMGLSPILVREVFDKISEINRDGMTVLLVEQNASLALKIAARAYVLAEGQVALASTASELATREDVRKAYLGA
jgi:branched-chain amino acid transport system ATP-binding protein